MIKWGLPTRHVTEPRFGTVCLLKVTFISSYFIFRNHCNKHLELHKTYQFITYFYLHIGSPFTFIISTFPVFLKSLNNYFCTACLKSLLSMFPVLGKSYYGVIQLFFCIQLFLHQHFRVQFSQDQGLSGSRISRSRFSGTRFFRAQVFQGLGPQSWSTF